MIVRALFTLIVIFLVYKIYQRLFRQKRCISCGKMIYREAAICHHCNTIQEDVEPVQAKAESAQTVSVNRGSRKEWSRRVTLLLSCAVILITLGVVAAVWLLQSV